MHIYERRQISNVRYCTRKIFGAEQAEFYATAIIAVIDGLWLKHAVRRQVPNFSALQVEALRITDRMIGDG